MKTTLRAGLCSSLVVASVACFSATAGAAGITAVQGTVSNGATITITGTGFGTKPNGAKPLVYWDPGRTGSTSLDTLSRKQTWDNDPQYGIISSGTIAPGSNYAYSITPNNANGVGGRGVIPGILTGTPLNLYIFHKWRTNWDGVDAVAQRSDWNFKGWRWADESFTHTIVEGYDGISHFGSPRYYFEGTASGGASWSGSGLVKDTWKTQEFQYLQGDIDVANANLKVSSNGVLETNYTNYSRTSSSPSLFGKIYAHQFERLTALPSWRLWYDVVYVDDSWARVVLTDQASWSTSVEHGIEIQIPTAWSDTSVTIKVRQGSFSSLSGKYLYVIGANGQPVSATGYALCSNCGSNPNPPGNVLVQ